MAQEGKGPESRAARTWRALRVLLVVGPIAAGGFYLGAGGYAPTTRVSPPEVKLPSVPEPRLEVVDAAGAARPTDTGPVRLGAGERLRLDGGELAQVRMESTALPVSEAVASYDACQRREGWALQPELSATVNELDRDAVLRVYVKKGSLRLLIIGPPQDAAQSVRPVTVFEGLFMGPGIG